MSNYFLRSLQSSLYTGSTVYTTVNTLVIPYFHYCSLAWSNNAAPFRLNKINKKIVDSSIFIARKGNCVTYRILESFRPIMPLVSILQTRIK